MKKYIVYTLSLYILFSQPILGEGESCTLCPDANMGHYATRYIESPKSPGEPAQSTRPTAEDVYTQIERKIVDIKKVLTANYQNTKNETNFFDSLNNLTHSLHTMTTFKSESNECKDSGVKFLSYINTEILDKLKKDTTYDLTTFDSLIPRLNRIYQLLAYSRETPELTKKFLDSIEPFINDKNKIGELKTEDKDKLETLKKELTTIEEDQSSRKTQYCPYIQLDNKEKPSSVTPPVIPPGSSSSSRELTPEEKKLNELLNAALTYIQNQNKPNQQPGTPPPPSQPGQQTPNPTIGNTGDIPANGADLGDHGGPPGGSSGGDPVDSGGYGGGGGGSGGGGGGGGGNPIGSAGTNPQLGMNPGNSMMNPGMMGMNPGMMNPGMMGMNPGMMGPGGGMGGPMPGMGGGMPPQLPPSGIPPEIMPLLAENANLKAQQAANQSSQGKFTLPQILSMMAMMQQMNGQNGMRSLGNVVGNGFNSPFGRRPMMGPMNGMPPMYRPPMMGYPGANGVFGGGMGMGGGMLPLI